MSNIYIQEPPTSGKVLLKTSVGDIDIELWSKECPKACRNFIQLCMEGYYNGTLFHRVVKGFIAQGGDPNGDGSGGESIFGKPFKDEFHTRLRYARRGLVGMANSGKDDNASQFFFTLAATPELQNKNTLFGKIAGDTIYNMLKLEECEVDHNERPFYQHRVISTEILSNPFSDIVPREKRKQEKKDKSRKREKGVKNFGLLSFGEEAAGDEQEAMEYVQKNASKAKSMHDVVDDPKLSKEAVRVSSSRHNDSDEEALPGDLPAPIKEEFSDEASRRQRIQSKLKSKTGSHKEKKPVREKSESDDEDTLLTQEQERARHAQKKKEEIRREIAAIKKEYTIEKRRNEQLMEQNAQKDEAALKQQRTKKHTTDNELMHDLLEEKEKYTSQKKKLPKKGADREKFTLELLSKFCSKLGSLKEKTGDNNNQEENIDDSVVEKEIQGDNWMAHSLKYHEKTAPVLAKDASTKDDDWYDAYDPRNPLNKRKRGEAAAKSTSRSSKHSRRH